MQMSGEYRIEANRDAVWAAQSSSGNSAASACVANTAMPTDMNSLYMKV